MHKEGKTYGEWDVFQLAGCNNRRTACICFADFYVRCLRTAEINTYDTKLKRCLLEYAEKYPQLYQLTEDDEQGGLRFEIAKKRISIRLTEPYSEE